jgi:hypothetical protein
MAEGGVPFRLYITGSVPRIPTNLSEEARATLAREQDTCKSSWKQLGAYFAEMNVDLVVGSTSERTADYCIIAGAKQFLSGKGDKKVNVTFVGRSYRSKHNQDAESDLEQFLPAANFNVKYEPTEGSGNSARLINGLKHADVVLLLCGGTSTATVGAACLYNRKPALALPQFEGSAEDLWEMFLPYYARGTLNQEEIRLLGGKWNENSAAAVFTALTKLKKYNAFEDRVATQQWILCVLPMLFIIAWLAAFCGQAPPYGVIGFALVALWASLIGSTARGIRTFYFERQARFSLPQLVAELALGVIVAFLSYLILQITGIIIEGNPITTDTLKNPEHFQRMAIAMTLLCFGGAYFVESSIKRLQVRIAGYGELF